MFRTLPQSDYTDFYDLARFKLTWNINVFLALFLPTLGVTFLYLGEMSAIPTFIGVLINLTLLLILKKTKSFFIPALIFGFLGTLLSQYTLNTYNESFHFVDTIWIMIIVLFVFFTLGKMWGAIILTLNVIGAVYYILFRLQDNLTHIKVLKSGDVTALAINFAISGVIIYFLISQFIDVTKYAEKKYLVLTNELKNKNIEKTTLLKEIHHRVKNNLQVITSLLRLQSREITDEKSLSVYEESIDRVVAMSLIHEKMYQTNNLSKINLREYISSLAGDLLESYGVNKNIVIDVQTNIEVITLRPLVPVALIFNELISNSLKHAFDDEKGMIEILIDEKDGCLKILYKDNGTWKNHDTSPSSFGLELIDSLTEQLNGTYSKDVSNGTEFKFELYPNV